MTSLNASTVPVAVRIRNARYDGMVTGFLHGAPTFSKTDPGGYRAGSFVVDQRLGFRSDMIQPYSRVYFYDKRGGATVFEGDVSHPGLSVGGEGSLLEVTVDGGAERLGDWAGARIYIDRDMQAWTKTSTSVVATNAEVGDDRGGSTADALTLAFPTDLHVDTNFRCEVVYIRIREASQELGWLNYAWDGGHTSGSPGWIVRSIVTPPSTVPRSQVLNIGGSGGSGAAVGVSIPVGADTAYLQLIWTGAASNTGSTGADIVWVSIMRPIVIARLKLRDGTYKTSASYGDSITAVDVWGDLLGEQLAAVFDGPNAQLSAGSSYAIQQLAFPDGITPAGVVDELMKLEPTCTYFVGPSVPGVDKYSVRWVTRSTVIRYELVIGTDDYAGGIQAVEQYNEAVTRWKTPVGNIRMTTSTQSIPEMTAVGRTRRFFQDLGTVTGDVLNAAQANAAVLEDHRYPRNGGRVTVARDVVDLFTGRRVAPFEIEPGYLVRLVGVDPSPDALNATEANGSTVCRIVSTDYSADTHSVDLALDSIPWSLFRAISNLTFSRPRPSGSPRPWF